MIIFPAIATVVSAVFAVLLLRQYSRAHRLSLLAWGVALAMYAAASIAVLLGTAQGWDPTLYRIFYLFGAMLNVPWLAVGSVGLLGRKELTYVALGIVVALSIFGFVKVVSSHPCRAIVGPSGHTQCDTTSTQPQAGVFGRKDIPSGADVWKKDASVRTLAIWYSTVAYLVVLGVAVFTSRARNGVAPPPQRRTANLLIAIGVTIVAIGSTALTRYGRGAAFSITLALGVAVMFTGFIMASRASRPAAPPTGDT